MYAILSSEHKVLFFLSSFYIFFPCLITLIGNCETILNVSERVDTLASVSVLGGSIQSSIITDK